MKNKGLFVRRPSLWSCVPKQSRPTQIQYSIWHLPTFFALMKAMMLALVHIFKLRKACVKSEALLCWVCAQFLISCHREGSSTNTFLCTSSKYDFVNLRWRYAYYIAGQPISGDSEIKRAQRVTGNQGEETMRVIAEGHQEKSNTSQKIVDTPLIQALHKKRGAMRGWWSEGWWEQANGRKREKERKRQWGGNVIPLFPHWLTLLMC